MGQPDTRDVGVKQGRSRHRLVLSVGIFVALIVGWELATALGESTIYDPINVATAHLTRFFFGALGIDTQVRVVPNPQDPDDRYIYVDTPIFNFELIGDCTAAHPIVYFLAAVLVYPGRWRGKAIGAALGVPVLILVNEIRLLTLCYFGHYLSKEAFDTVHMQVWQSLMVFITLALWAFWAMKLERSPAAAPAATA